MGGRRVQWEPRFIDYLVGQLGLSPKTCRIYLWHVREAARWCEERGLRLSSLQAQAVAELAKTVPFTASSRRALRTALTHYWAMLGRTDPPVRAIRVPRKPDPRWRGLSPEHARLMVKMSVGWYPEGTAVLFGFYLALRREEIAMARWDRLEDQGYDIVYTVTGKFDRTSTLPVHGVLADELARLRHTARGLWIFPGARGRPHVTGMTVHNWVQRVADVAGVGKVTAHQLRHTAIAWMNDATSDLVLTQEYARHRDPATTKIYTRVTSDRLRQGVDHLDYLSDIER